MTRLIDRGATTSSARVVFWRAERLLGVGFPPALARELAADCGVDLHALLDLVARGCPPALAARILDPVPGAARPC